jgi:hypothetical protein
LAPIVLPVEYSTHASANPSNLYILPSVFNTATSVAVIVSPSVKLDGVIEPVEKGIIQEATFPLASNTGTLFSSAAPLDVFTNIAVSVTSTSKSKVSAAHGLIIVFLSQSPAVNLSFPCPTVVSVALTEKYWSAPLPVVNVFKLTSEVSSSVNFIEFPSFLILNALPLKSRSNVVLVLPPVASSLLLIAVLISSQKAKLSEIITVAPTTWLVPL